MLRLSRTSGRKLHRTATESSTLRAREKLSEESEWFWEREGIPPGPVPDEGPDKTQNTAKQNLLDEPG